MAAHTPGPWHLINSVCVGGPIEPGWEDAGTGIAHCGMRARTQEEAEANALLIAAAPDIYAALANLVEVVGRRNVVADQPNGLMKKRYIEAKAALAKARGDN